MRIPVTILPGNEDLPLPSYRTPMAAGLDLHAAVSRPLILESGKIKQVPCGFSLAIPTGLEAQIRSRSGLALSHSVIVANSPGTIDPDFRGEVHVLLLNIGTEPFTITRGMRIAQLVFSPVTLIQWNPVSTLDRSVRGSGGFGHTGLDDL